VDALGRRQRTLEDELLDVLEAAEPLAAEVDRLGAQRDAAANEADRLRADVAAQEAAIDAEMAAARERRGSAAADVGEALLDRYEKLRARLGGIAVARLDGDRCLGCHVALSAVELDQARHAAVDAIIVHEDCGRILVRSS